jgi:hypothetical protein
VLSTPFDFTGLIPQGCSTLCGGGGESSLPQVGGERRRQADGRIPGSANL